MFIQARLIIMSIKTKALSRKICYRCFIIIGNHRHKGHRILYRSSSVRGKPLWTLNEAGKTIINPIANMTDNISDVTKEHFMYSEISFPANTGLSEIR